MKQQMTNHHLDEVRKNIESMATQNPFLRLLVQDKISNFMMRNQMCLKILDSKMVEFIAKYVKHDDEGKPMFEVKSDGAEYIFDSEEKRKEYLEQVTEFMNRSVTVVF